MSYTEKNGYGSPYVTLYYGGVEITQQVSFFVIKYSEKNGNSIEFVVESENPDIVDEKPYQEHDKIEIIHGYLNGPASAPLIYYVREVQPTFSPTGINLRITALDRASYLKETSSLLRNPSQVDSETRRLATRADILARLEYEYGMKVRVQGHTLTNISNMFDDNNEVLPAYRQYLFDKTFNENKKTLKYDTPLIGIAINDANQSVDRQLNDLEKLLPFLREEVTPVQISTQKDNVALKQVMRGAPATIQITSEGDDIDIASRNFNQSPKRTYRYKDDSSFLDFTPESENRTQGSKATNINITIPDREGKSYKRNNFTEADDNSTRLGSILPAEVKRNFRLNRDGIMQNTGNVTGGSIHRPNAGGPYGISGNQYREEQGLNLNAGTFMQVISGEATMSYWYQDPYYAREIIEDLVVLEGAQKLTTQSTSYIKGGGIQTAAVDALQVQLPPPKALMSAMDFIEATADASENVAENDALNDRNNAAIEMNPGTLKVIYDPELKNKIVIRIENVGKKYSHNYYVIDCEHFFQKGSYVFTQMNVGTNGKGKTGNENDAVTTAEFLQMDVNNITRERRDNERNVKIVDPKTNK